MNREMKRIMDKTKAISRGISPLDMDSRKSILENALLIVKDENIEKYLCFNHIIEFITDGIAWMNGEKVAPMRRLNFVYCNEFELARKYDRAARVCFSANQIDLGALYIGVVINTIQDACIEKKGMINLLAMGHVYDEFFEQRRLLNSNIRLKPEVFFDIDDYISYANDYKYSLRYKYPRSYMQQTHLNRMEKSLNLAERLCAGYFISFFDACICRNNDENTKNGVR